MSASRTDKYYDPLKDLKAAPAVPTKAVGASAGAVAVAKAAAKTTDRHPLFNLPAPLEQLIFSRLDSQALACLLRVSKTAKTFTAKELHARNQKDAKRIIDLTLRGEVSHLELVKHPSNNTPYRVSNQRHLYLYRDDDGRVFYYYKEGTEQQKHYVRDDEKNEAIVMVINPFLDSTQENSVVCMDKALQKEVFDITTKRGHTRRSDSEEIEKMVDKNQGLPFVVYQPATEEDKIACNRGGQRISLIGKTPLQVAYAEKHDPAIKAMTAKLLAVTDKNKKQINENKILAQYLAQNAPAPAQEEQDKAKRLADVLAAQKALTKVVLDSKQGDIRNSGYPHYKVVLLGKGGEAIAAAIKQLEKALQSVRELAVTTGYHYNPEPLLQAQLEYDRLLAACNYQYEAPIIRLLFRNLGRYQRMMSLGYVHGYSCEGLRANVKNLQQGKSVLESTIITMWDPFRKLWGDLVSLHSVTALGDDYGIDAEQARVGRDGRCPNGGQLLKSYINQIEQAHKTVTQEKQNHPSSDPRSSVCVIL